MGLLGIFRGALLAVLLGLAGAASSPASAQDVLRAVAVVNDEVISMLDLEMRINLAILATGENPTETVKRRMAPQVMRALIDERLQLQEAERLGITISDEQIDDAFAEIAGRNNMTPEEFGKLLKSRGVLPQVMRSQIRAQLAWDAVIRRRLRPEVQISDEEIDEVVERMSAAQGTTQRLISEIFLSVDNVREEDRVREGAQRLFEQVRSGGNFPALARQFSESATAVQGGDLGWVPEGQLPEEVERALDEMRPGTISPPIRSADGYHIVALRDERQVAPSEVTLDLKQVLIALPEDADTATREAASERAADLRQQITGCDGVEALASEVGSPGSGSLGEVKLSDLPPNVREALRDLPVGTPSEPVEVPGGLSLLVVCDRTDGGVDRGRIRDQLTLERLDMLARRYMRDLRANANVDMRI